jgi:monoamine oxidase
VTVRANDLTVRARRVIVAIPLAIAPGRQQGQSAAGIPQAELDRGALFRWRMISHAPTGVLTQFGYTLREPCGRVHWAGTESSAIMCGWVDGAIRSGERAAAEVMSHEAESVA